MRKGTATEEEEENLGKDVPKIAIMQVQRFKSHAEKTKQ